MPANDADTAIAVINKVTMDKENMKKKEHERATALSASRPETERRVWQPNFSLIKVRKLHPPIIYRFCVSEKLITLK